MLHPMKIPELRARAIVLSTVTLLFLLLHSATAITNSKPSRQLHRSPLQFIRSSCIHARYPNLCLRSLSSYSGPASPRCIAQAAVRTSLFNARSVSYFLRTRVPGRAHLSKLERAALNDCVEQISDSVYELRKTLGELQHLKLGESTFRWRLSNAETWVSAALTDDDTCLDGFDEADGSVKTQVRRKISQVARLTSNALYMINRLDDSRGRP
ncbi:hypothetical protein SAY87_026045 [Trapa incisa]|uniref:Pectinesterase inhibitor domain-containing protein n=1 Tax=Trapa incisa TaxID=236973 RepID=A0AAN7JKU3_9MYRT|nr:hypothetical protein SAY87_026045 [Trapa incisa]